jgi:hypothetical protein
MPAPLNTPKKLKGCYKTKLLGGIEGRRPNSELQVQAEFGLRLSIPGTLIPDEQDGDVIGLTSPAAEPFHRLRDFLLQNVEREPLLSGEEFPQTPVTKQFPRRILSLRNAVTEQNKEVVRFEANS